MSLLDQRRRFIRQAQDRLQDGWESEVTIAGRVRKAAVHRGPITVELPGTGTVQKRALFIHIRQRDLPHEPPVGALVTHDGKDYEVNSTQDPADAGVSWRLVCIEKDRSP